MKNFSVKPDIKNNILRCSLSRKFTKQELGKFYTEIRFAVADLKPGFDVITDYTNCTIVHLDSIATFQKIMNYLIASGVNEVFRVMPPENVFCKQLSTVTERSASYRPIVVANQEEAEERRASLTPRTGIRFYPNNWRAHYNTASLEGEGLIHNISISGCRLSEVTRELAQETSCNLVILPGDEVTGEPLNLGAKVVRNVTDGFAVQFEELSDETKKKLNSYLLKACEQEIPRRC